CGGIDGRDAGSVAAAPLLVTHPDRALVRAAQLLAEHSASHLVVLDRSSHRPVGILPRSISSCPLQKNTGRGPSLRRSLGRIPADAQGAPSRRPDEGGGNRNDKGGTMHRILIATDGSPAAGRPSTWDSSLPPTKAQPSRSSTWCRRTTCCRPGRSST